MHYIRHGQSEFNIAMNTTGQDPGIVDAPLTEQGRAQALAAANTLSEHKITHLVSSPYTRALQTASIIAAHIDVPIKIEPLAGERSVFTCDIGTPTSRLRAAWPQLDFSDLPEKWWPDPEESHDHLNARVQNFHEKWRDIFALGQTGLVSHWYFLNTLLGHNFQNGEVVTKKIF